MLVKIKKYPRPVRCYDLAKWLWFWQRDEDKVLDFCEHIRKTKFGTWLDNREVEQKVQVRIDPWDVWSLDTTLAKIILPALIKLKGVKHGSPTVDLEDVPLLLRKPGNPDYSGQLHLFEDNQDLEYEALHRRWDWVLSELIWTFEQLNSDWESQYYDHTNVDENLPVTQQVKLIKFDKVGFTRHQERIQHGLQLFGKYYQALWD